MTLREERERERLREERRGTEREESERIEKEERLDEYKFVLGIISGLMR